MKHYLLAKLVSGELILGEEDKPRNLGEKSFIDPYIVDNWNLIVDPFVPTFGDKITIMNQHILFYTDEVDPVLIEDYEEMRRNDNDY